MDENSKNKIGLVIFIVVLIVILAAVGVHFYNSNQSEVENFVSQGEMENVETNQKENLVESENTVQETKLSIEDETVKKLVEKIAFPTYATASVYHAGDFDLNTIPNDLILRLGWSKIDYDDRNTNLDKQTVSAEKMKENIAKIFGSKLQYENKTFNNIDVETFSEYNENIGDIEFANNVYTANFFEGGGGDMPFIYQQVYQATQTGDTIKLFVKTAFIDTEYNENTEGFNYFIYQNFENDQFENKLGETTDEKFLAPEFDYNHVITVKPNSEMVDVLDKLDSYVYVFTLDEATNEYGLTSFSKEK